MVKKYKLDLEDENIINELDNFCGVVQNKDIFRDIILYTKLRQNNIINFGNYNVIIRNDSSYCLLKDLINVYVKILLKYKIIRNNNICFLDKVKELKNNNTLIDKILEIDDSIIVINEKKLRFDLLEEIDQLKEIMKKSKEKIFIFEDTNFCEGDVDAKLGDIACWRMTIEKISLEDKIMYCENKLNANNLDYKKNDLKDFADVPFWTLKNMIIKLIVESKSRNINIISKQMLNDSKEKNINNNSKIENKSKNKKINTNSEKELNKLIGLEDVKTDIQKIINYIKLNKKKGEMPTLHMCFTGNPGTGKTTIARIIGKIFQEENILKGNGNFLEIHGRDLVDKFVGWTAQNVHEIIKKAIGGVLFIDEAYSLISDRRGSFEDEAIATLIKEMEDHRNEICIIFAGYTKEMNNLIKLNPGLESRIQFIIEFPDYSENELLEIFLGMCKKENFKLSQNDKNILLNNFKIAKYKENFGNGRYVRNLFEKIKIEQANRIIKTNSKALNNIKKEDIENALKEMNFKVEKYRKIGF